MLMKLEPGNSWKQSLADDVASQVKHNWIVGASRNVFCCGCEMKFSDVCTAQ